MRGSAAACHSTRPSAPGRIVGGRWYARPVLDQYDPDLWQKWAELVDDPGLLYDERQWVMLSDARLIYEARRGRCAEVEEDDEGGVGMIGGIWDTAFEKRLQGYPPMWCWLWRWPA